MQPAPTSSRDPSVWGQLLMVGIPGPRLDEVGRGLIRDLQVGGIILFARNLESPEQVWELTGAMQREALAARGRPLLIALDQEGGRVQRLKSPFTIIPPARELGNTATPAQVGLLCRQVARELALVGVNMNLAPVLDVARRPECPLWDRSYSSEAPMVAAFGIAAFKGYLAGGVIPVAKHFPGLGDTLADSHEVLPLAQSGDPERTRDLFPFRQAVAAQVPAIMTAHLLVPSWDSRPATLSPVALQQWLRQKLGFQGVIITDDLEMGAISTKLPVAAGAKAALAAGADLLLVCQDWQGAWEAARLLSQDKSLAARGHQAAVHLARLQQFLPGAPVGLKTVQEYFQKRR